MPLPKAPAADYKRTYPLFLQVGLLLALGVLTAAFTIPLPEPDRALFAVDAPAAIEIETVPPTAEVMPPPPPPPAPPPPPQEVPDDVPVQDVLDAVTLDLLESVPPPIGPPITAVVPPTPPIVTPPVPPTPPEPIVDADVVFVVVEQEPVLIDGLEGLQRRVVYPEFARQAGVQGTVYVQFVVDQTGTVTEPVVLRSPNALLSEAALAAVRTARFEPGQQRGRPVKVRYQLPVRFTLR